MKKPRRANPVSYSPIQHKVEDGDEACWNCDNYNREELICYLKPRAKYVREDGRDCVRFERRIEP